MDSYVPMFHARYTALIFVSFLLAVGCKSKDGDDSETSSEEESSAASGPPTGTSVDCGKHLDQASCAAEGSACQFFAGTREAVIQDDMCVRLEGEIGFCLPEVGGSATPGAWYEVATGRVFPFANNPFSGPAGWSQCTCEPSEPDACMCMKTIFCNETGTGASETTSEGP